MIKTQSLLKGTGYGVGAIGLQSRVAVPWWAGQRKLPGGACLVIPGGAHLCHSFQAHRPSARPREASQARIGAVGGAWTGLVQC